MSDETWKTQYKKWKDLKPYQIKLIDDEPKSQSQAWLFNSMWCDWMDLSKSVRSDFSEKIFQLVLTLGIHKVAFSIGFLS
tara:strand:- start:6689 stop:6928 length:240 start_codon:yes stop_codon:yes gene_type:complete